jgi:hypothetical protein
MSLNLKCVALWVQIYVECMEHPYNKMINVERLITTIIHTYNTKI